MARGEFTHEPAPPSPRPHSHSLQLLWQVSRSRRRANTDGKVMSYEQEEGGCWCKVVVWSRASRPRPRPSSSACSCSQSSPSSPSRCCLSAWPVDALQARTLDEFILFDRELLYTLRALYDTDASARVWCACVSFTVTLRSVLECCAYEYKGTGQSGSKIKSECAVTFHRVCMVWGHVLYDSKHSDSHTKLWTDQGSLWLGQPVPTTSS